MHPLLLDGCFQAFGSARNPDGGEEGITYLPFAWERLWIKDRLPERLVCHVQVRQGPEGGAADTENEGLPEVHAADLRLYDQDGALVGELVGFTVKRATRATLLAAVEGVEELIYEVVWRDSALPPGMPPADFLPSPSAAASGSQPFSRYLAHEGVEVGDEGRSSNRNGAGVVVLRAHGPGNAGVGAQGRRGSWIRKGLRERLEVLPEHAHLFRRMLEILARSDVLLQAKDESFVVATAADDPLPDDMPRDREAFLAEVTERFPHATNEVGLFRRCAGALPEVLRGKEDPLSLLFGDAEPQAGDLYRRAPVWRAANRMLGEVVQALVEELPEGRRLRVLEVGAASDRRPNAFCLNFRPTVRLHVYGHLRGLFRGCGDALQRRGCSDRLPGAGYREGIRSTRASSLTLTTW